MEFGTGDKSRGGLISGGEIQERDTRILQSGNGGKEKVLANSDGSGGVWASVRRL